MDPKEFEKMYDGMPDALKGILMDFALKSMRDRYEKTGDPELKRALEIEKEMRDLNDQIINTLGVMKNLLKGFDENDHNPVKAKDNLVFYQRFMSLMGPSLMNLHSNMQEAIKRMSKEEE